MSTSSGWLLQRVRIRTAMMEISRTLRHHLHLRRHGKLQWPLPTPTRSRLCNPLQERNQGNQGNGNNQTQFATLNQFLANQPKSFSKCAEATNADDWLMDICKHFECSNVSLRTLSSLLRFNSRIKLLSGINNTKIPEEVV